jgi:hypothetical protein
VTLLPPFCLPIGCCSLLLPYIHTEAQ